MKAKKAIAILLALVLVLSLCPAISLADDTVENDSLNLESAVSAGDYAWEAIDADDDGEADYYVMSGITYCANPVERFADYETLDIYVPAAYLNADGSVNAEGTSNGYTYSSAPIVLPTNMGMYGANLASSKSYTSFSGMLDCGYVVINIGHRGIIRGGDEYAGDAATSPNAVVDTKAGIRYIKYNADFIPGDESKLVTTGNSGSGALSMFIACTGNAVEYAPYLVEIGAIGVTKNEDGTYNMTDGASDNVYASNAYCPIADVANADMAYEWLFGTDEQLAELGVTAMQEALSGYLADAFYDYVNDTIGMTDTEFDAVMTAAVERAMNTFFENMRDGNANVGQTDGQYEVTWTDDAVFADAENPTLEEVATNFIAGNWEWDSGRRAYIYGSDTNVADWLTWNSDTQRAEVTSLYEFGNYFSRQKDVGAFDALDRNATENTPFGNAAIGPQHYSESLYNVLVENKDALSALWTDADAENTGCESYDALLDAYYNDIYVAGDDGISVSSDRYGSNIAALYSHLLFIDDNTDEYEGETSEHVRIRMGCYDANTAAAVIVLMGEAFDKAGVDVDYGLVWNGQHGDCDYGDDSLYDWIDELCAPDSGDEPAEPISLDLAAAIADGTYKWELLTDESGDYYQLSNVVYCANPTDDYYDDEHYFQSIVIIVPTEYLNADGTVNNSGVVNGYTAETAPIIVKNNCQGWMSSKPTTANDDSVITYRDYIDNGFIYIGCGARSRNIDNGTAPAPIVDIKAAIRFIRLNDDAIPGTSEKLVSMGGSGAGEMSSVIGASGNMSEYYSYLYAIGAAGIDLVDGEYVSTISDAVDACMAFYPIGDIENADMAYSWLRFDSGETGLTKRGVTTEFTEFQLALQNDLAAAFCEYVNGLQLTNEDGTVLTLTSARDGSYYDQILQNLSDALNKYLACYGAEETEALIATYTDTEKWLVKNDDGTYSVTDISGMLNGTGLARNKDITGFDAFDLSAENNAFGTIAEGKAHYSMSVATVLKENYDKYSVLEGFDKESVDNFIAVLERDDIAQQTYLMNATTIMLNAAAGEQETDIAPYWRIRSGTADQHTSFSVGYNMALAAMANDGIDVDYSLVWNMVHGNEIEGESTGTFLGWVEEIFPAETTDEPTVGNTSVDDATVTILTPHVDGKEIKVTMYEDCYVSNPNREVDQQISIYIPENATADSPIMFYVNNGGWQSNAYTSRTQVQTYQENVEQTNRDGSTSYVTLGDYSSTSDSDKVGVALSEGYVIVSYGARSRNNGTTTVDGEELYLGHSPATMTDTKAAIRYLRYNAEALGINTDAIVVTGTSGGGALSTVIAASGNSSDFYESLYEIGAAGITKAADGSYVNDADCGDNVLAVIAYCPITDFAGADMAYEWTYNGTRYTVQGETVGRSTYTEDEEILDRSDILAAAYSDYLADLGLTYNGVKVTTDNMEDIIVEMMMTEIDTTLAQGSTLAELIADTETVTLDGEFVKWLVEGESTEDGYVYNETNNYSYNYDLHRVWLALTTFLKDPCAFSNYGFGGSMNEDNVFGTVYDEYSPFEFLSWELDDIDNNVGQDNTKMTWDEYMKTDEGEYLALQLRMTSALAYLTDLQGAEPATYWYVRHGMADRDTSFAVEASLFLAIENNIEAGTIESANTGFAWLRPHSGDYDVQEAYAWLDEVLNGTEETEGPDVTVTTSVSNKTITVKVTSDETADYTIVLTDEDGEVVDTQTASGTSATVKFTGLTNGDEYTVTVTAETSDGGKTTVTKTATPKSYGGGGSTSGGTSTGNKITDDSSDDTTTTTGTFTDVSTDTYYYDAVEWAVENGITTGTSDTTFSPEIGCSRAQIVTFLWRAAGSPETEGENPFTDVAADAYYYDAILWAVANGITNGTTDTTFSPDDTCTRGQIVTFLYRYAGASAEATATFSDEDVNFYYAAPVAWAVANGITNGTSDTTFSPDDACTRAQVVTFLYRYSAV